jgi:hypothetical protein
MRCLLCNAEMTLMNVVRDDTMVVAGFEHHTFSCSSCHDIERRLVFVRAERSVLVTQSIASEQGGNVPVASPDKTPTIKPTLFDEHAVAHQDTPIIGVQDEPAFQDQRVITYQDAPIVGVQDEPAFQNQRVIAHQDASIIGVQNEPTAAVQEEQHAVADRNVSPVNGQDERAVAVQNERGTFPGMYRRVLTMLRGR